MIYDILFEEDLTDPNSRRVVIGRLEVEVEPSSFPESALVEEWLSSLPEWLGETLNENWKHSNLSLRARQPRPQASQERP